MATVGKMVIGRTAEWLFRGQLGPIDQVAETSTQRALESLGIWDAEVLEGEYSGLHARLDSDPSFQGVPILSDLDAWFQHNIMAGKRKGRFRIIVLPVEEE